MITISYIILNLEVYIDIKSIFKKNTK
jgi:hypothetical protein